jgi:hypothetical protein
MKDNIHPSIIRHSSRVKEILDTNPKYRKLRFKKLNIEYQYEFENEQVDVVDWFDFIEPETDRFPMLIGNRGGLWPKTIQFDILFNQPQTVAVLNVYLYSDYLNDILMCRVPSGFDIEKYSLENCKPFFLFPHCAPISHIPQEPRNGN